MWEEILDALLDTAKVIPILFIVYVLISYFSHNSNKYLKFMERTKKLGPIVGATTGVLPQCGFSIVMSDLYTKKKITLGTLIAVFVATSDEALPLMISEPAYIPKLLILLLIKFVYAIFCGYLIDVILNSIKKQKQEKLVLETGKTVTYPESMKARNCENCSNAECNCENCEHNEQHETVHHHNHCCADNIFVDALIHTAEIAGFVLVATIAINLILFYAGEDALLGLFTNNSYVQVVISSLIGLIPNCAASVVLVELFMEGAITFGALLAGLTTGAGVGLLVLFKNNPKKWKESLAILLIMYILGILLGFVVNLCI